MGGGIGDPSDYPTGPPVAFEQYCERLAAIGCDAALRCDCIEADQRDQCMTYIRLSECGDIESPVQAGRASFDPVAGGNCLAGIKAVLRDCSFEGDGQPAACDRMLVGLVPEGERCDGGDECQGALECYDDRCIAVPTHGADCAEGVCAEDLQCGPDNRCIPYGSRGDACGDARYCDDDLYCDSRGARCQPYLRAGQECALNDSECDDDLYCSPERGTCAPFPGVGGDCGDSGGDCIDGAWCGPGGTCRAQGGQGAECDDDEQCRSWDCLDGYCDGDGDGDDSVCSF